MFWPNEKQIINDDSQLLTVGIIISTTLMNIRLLMLYWILPQKPSENQRKIDNMLNTIKGKWRKGKESDK